MKISNYTNCYPILKKNKNNNKEKSINNYLSNQTNPFDAFYDFQVISSIAFMGKTIKYPPFYVVDKDCNIVKDEEDKPMEFTSALEVRDRMELALPEQNGINRIFNENSAQKTFSHEGTRYTCILKDDVTKDDELDRKLLASKVWEIFTPGNAFRKSFYMIDKDYNIIKDEQSKPIEFTSAAEVRDRLGLTPLEQNCISRILNKNAAQKTFSYKGSRYACILKDDVTRNGETDKALVEGMTDKAFMNSGTDLYPPFYIVDDCCNVIKDEHGKPIEFTYVSKVSNMLGLTLSKRNGVYSILDENKNTRTFSHEGTRYTCILKDDVAKDGELDEELLQNKAQEIFAITNGARAVIYPPFYVVDKNCNIIKDEQGNPIEFTSIPKVKDKLKLTQSEQCTIIRIFNKKYRDKTFSHDGIKYTCILKDKVSNLDGSVNEDMLKNEIEQMFGRRKTSKR